MGAFCCCPCGEDFEEYAHASSSIYRHCICIRYFFYQLFGGYSGISQRLEGRAVTSSGVTPLPSTGLSTASADSSLSESYHLVPRPAPYDTDPRYSRSQRDGLVSRREKGTSHNQDESEMLRRNSSSSGVEHLGAGKKRNDTNSEECKASRAESERNLFAKLSYGTDYTITNTEDDDVCPTCLEGFSLFTFHRYACSYPLKRKGNPVHEAPTSVATGEGQDNILLRIPKSLPNVLITFTLAAFMSGWKEVTTAQFVARRWSSARVPDRVIFSCAARVCK